MSYAERIRTLALSFPKTYEDSPWGHPVFKVANNKMFAAMSNPGEPLTLTVKLTAEEREIAHLLPYVRVASHVGRFAVVDPLRLVPVRDELRDVPDVDRERLVDPEPDRERLLVGDFGGVAARARETPSSVGGSPPTFSSSTRSGSALKPAYGSDPSWVLYSSK